MQIIMNIQAQLSSSRSRSHTEQDEYVPSQSLLLFIALQRTGTNYSSIKLAFKSLRKLQIAISVVAHEIL